MSTHFGVSGGDDDQKPTTSLAAAAAVFLLLLLGLGALVFGSLVWLNTSAPGKSSVSKMSTTAVTIPADKGRRTTTTVVSKDTTTPGKASVRSEAVAGTLFGIGALLVLCGLFFTRITKVTLPGGAGFELEPEAQAKIVEKAAETAKARNLPQDPATLGLLYRIALQELAQRQPIVTYPRQDAWQGLRTSPGDSVIAEAVVAAADRYEPEQGVFRPS